MQYVIKSCLGSYYKGLRTHFAAEYGQWGSLKNATVFDTLEEAQKVYDEVKNVVLPSYQFDILEYHPATVGNVVHSEKDVLIKDLQEIIVRVNNGSVSWNQIKGIVPTINSAIKFIERNVND